MLTEDTKMTTLEESVFFIKPPALEQAEKIINELKPTLLIWQTRKSF